MSPRRPALFAAPALALLLAIAGGGSCAGPGGPRGPEDGALELRELWDFADPAASEQRFLARADGSEGPARLAALTQVARAQGLQQRFAEAFATLAEVEAAAPADAAGVLGRLALERGRLQRDTGDGTAAQASFRAAFDAFESAGADALAVDAAHMVALVAEDHAQRVAWTERALELAESSREPAARAWRASLLNNLAWEHFDAGAPAKALPHFERALELRAEAGTEPAWRIARWTVARCLRELGRTEDALRLQRALAADLEAEGIEDGYVHEELGHLLTAIGLPHEAAEQFGRAHALLSLDAWLVENEPNRIADLLQRSRP